VKVRRNEMKKTRTNPMSRYRKLEPQEQQFWMGARDKEDGLHLLNERRVRMGIGDDRVPYYIKGRKTKSKQEPVYNNGRLITNQWGQTRVYLDWDVAERTNALQGFSDWGNE
jgi:hypothetical protein